MDALAVVIDRHRQLLLGGFLPDHVLIQKFLHFQGLRNLVGNARGRLDFVVLQNRVAYGDALVTDIGAGIVAGGGDEFADYVLALMTKRAPQSIIGSGALHAVFSSSEAGREPNQARGRPVWGTSIRFVSIITRIDFLGNVPKGHCGATGPEGAPPTNRPLPLN